MGCATQPETAALLIETDTISVAGEGVLPGAAEGGGAGGFDLGAWGESLRDAFKITALLGLGSILGDCDHSIDQDGTQRVSKGRLVIYRVWGGDANPVGRYWSEDSPYLDPKEYARKMGVPPYDSSTGKGNTGQYVTIGLWDGNGAIRRTAIPADGFPDSGGGTEIFFPNGIGDHVIPIPGPPLPYPASFQ